MQKKKGITLIELIFIIIIFGIGILTVFVMVLKNLYLIQQIKLKTTSTFLAKEAIEIVYNTRDKNIQRSLIWQCNYTPGDYACTSDIFTGDKYYQVSVDMLTGYYTMSGATSTGFDNNVLYYHTGDIKDKVGTPLLSGFWYDHNELFNGIPGEKTYFSRYVAFKQVYLSGDGGYGDPERILKLESVVNYKKGGIEGQIMLESFIGKIK